MGRVEEIEAANDGLSPEEYRRVVQWFRVREQKRWDDQLDSDSSGGMLDFLFDEAESESAEGLLRSGRRKSEIVATRRFWELFQALPAQTQSLAAKNYHL